MKFVLSYAETTGEKSSKIHLMEITPNSKFIEILDEEGSKLGEERILEALAQIPLEMDLIHREEVEKDETPKPVIALVIKVCKNLHKGLTIKIVPSKQFRGKYRLSFIRLMNPEEIKISPFTFYRWDKSGLHLEAEEHEIFINLPQ